MSVRTWTTRWVMADPWGTGRAIVVTGGDARTAAADRRRFWHRVQAPAARG